MDLPGLSKLQKALQIAFIPKHAWRRRLFVVRRGIDSALPEAEISEKLENDISRLLSAAIKHPDALIPTLGQLRRVRRQQDLSAVVQQVWAEGNPVNSSASLACAQVWYETGNIRLGDMALDRAKSMDPENTEIFIEEANNQRKRGNLSAAIESAERVVELTDSQHEVREWQRFLGEVEFERGDYLRASDILLKYAQSEQNQDKVVDNKILYPLGLALQKVGRTNESDTQFLKLEQFESGDPSLRRAKVHFNELNYPEVVRVLTGQAGTPESELLLDRARLMVGDFEVIRDSPSDSYLSRLEWQALACELDGDYRAAIEHYLVLLEPGIPGSRGDAIRRRASRVAFVLGEHELSVKFELECPDLSDHLDRFHDEVHPSFNTLSQSADEFLRANAPDQAIPLLKQLSYSASTRMNIRISARVLARAHAKQGNFEDASKAFFRVNPYRLPHAEEGLEQDKGLNKAEFYSEGWEALGIDEDIVLYESFHGASTACNPLAICRELLDSPQRGDLQHVWAIEPGCVIHPSLLGRPNVHFVQRGSWGYYNHLASAGYVVNNTTFPHRYVRKPGQRYVNTWHGIPWKYMGKDVLDNPYGYDNVARNFLQSTELLLPDTHTAETLIRTQDLSEILRIPPIIGGSPRVDQTLTMSEDGKLDIRNKLGIRQTTPVVFYAPTWRGTQSGLQFSPAPYIEAIRVLASHNVNVVIRFHHFLQQLVEGIQLPHNVLIAPAEVDTNEILAVTDVLVSDYSSLIFDYAPLNKPIIKYVFDLDEYLQDRGLYFSLEEVPGESCRTLDELQNLLRRIIDEPDTSQYSWHELDIAKLWSNEDGNATRRAVRQIFDRTAPANSEKQKNVVVSLSGMRANGVTRSLRNLLATYSGDTHVQIFVPKAVLSTPESLELAAEMHKRAGFTLYGGILTGTRQESIAWKRMQDLRNVFPSKLEPWIASRMNRERKRYFGESEFTAAVDFDGYRTHQAALLGLGFPNSVKTSYIAHNEFKKEMNIRFPKMREIGSVLHNFDVIASVSDSVMKQNKADLAEEFGVDEERHRTLVNTIDLAGIVRQGSEELDADLREWFGRPNPHVIVVARLSVEKNHASLFDAIAEQKRGGIDINVLLLGSGPREQALREQARALQIEGQIMFGGQRSNPYPAIRRSDGLLLPSTHEGQGLVLLEAMALGVPVAATDIPGPASVLKNGEHGLLVPLGVEGIKYALDELAAGNVAVSKIDLEEYQRSAMDGYEDLLVSSLRSERDGTH